MKVAVCVATYQRPSMLAALLRSLESLELRDPATEVVVIVVDNDHARSASPVLASLGTSYRWPVRSAHEPERNIALVRNHCVRLALEEGAHWLAFIDDDERAGPRWLAELLRVQAAHDADVVGGAVVKEYPVGTPAWRTAVSGHVRTRHPDGAAISIAETANALVSRAVIEAAAGPFDPAFGRTGGSDSHLFLRARLAGARIVWADDAVVYETVPASRTTTAWMLRRAFRLGNSAVLVAGSVLPLWHWLPRRFAGACYRAALGVAQIPLALVRGRGGMVAALQNLSIAIGAFAGMVGIRYVEYERSHGA